jgi:protein involved in sex pheromone biosynthesis
LMMRIRAKEQTSQEYQKTMLWFKRNFASGLIMSNIWHRISSKSTGSWVIHSMRCSCSS